MRNMLMVAALALAAGCNNQGGGAAASKTPTTEDEKTLYALGTQIGGERGIGEFNLTAEELEFVKQGLTDKVTGAELKIQEPQQYAMKIQQMFRQRTTAKAEAEKTRGKEFYEKAAQEPGAVKTDSGVIIKKIEEGTGASPSPTDRVKVHYTGRFTDGREFDSSAKNNAGPVTFPLNGVIPCWTEGLQKMKVGGKAQLVCPSNLAYGDRGKPGPNGIPGGATLVFDVELLEIVPSGTPPDPGTKANPADK